MNIKKEKATRLVELTARLTLSPSQTLSLTDLGVEYDVSKTVISSDVDIIGNALKTSGIMHVERGRNGGARFIPSYSGEQRRQILSDIAEKLSNPDRRLPGGLLYYSDILFNPETAVALGYCMTSLFTDKRPDVVMTTEMKGIPIAMFAAYALGVPLAVCRFTNRPSDGAAVCVHYPTGSGDVKTMYMGTRQLPRKSEVLIIDDFMRGGSTASGMLLMAEQFEAHVCGVGIFIAHDEPAEKAVPDYKSLLTLTKNWEIVIAE